MRVNPDVCYMCGDDHNLVGNITEFWSGRSPGPYCGASGHEVTLCAECISEIRDFVERCHETQLRSRIHR